MDMTAAFSTTASARSAAASAKNQSATGRMRSKHRLNRRHGDGDPQRLRDQREKRTQTDRLLMLIDEAKRGAGEVGSEEEVVWLTVEQNKMSGAASTAGASRGTRNRSACRIVSGTQPSNGREQKK
jgi:hypothetical protein